MGVVPAPLVFFWTLVGAAVGALVAALIARNQFVGARRDYRKQLERRDVALERLRMELDEDRSDFVQRSDDYLRQLAALKRTRASLNSELEEARRAMTSAQNDLETLRISARESESRFSIALGAARDEAAALRTTAAEELRIAMESAGRARGELSRRIVALEADRSRLEADLAAERSRMETDLATERRASSQRQESLRSILTTLREQYSLASTERDTLARELEAERARAESAEAALRRAREEYSARLDAEHQESMELISRMWEYVHEHTRVRLADVAPADRAIEAEPPADLAPHARPGPSTAPPAPVDAEPQPLTTDREVATPHARTMGDRCPADDYDIERALDETLPSELRSADTAGLRAEPPAADEVTRTDAAPSQTGQPEPATPGSPQPERGWRSVPPPAPASTRVRRPVSAMRRGDDVLVVCDDGSVWMRRPTGWIEEPPIPGSDANGERANGVRA